MADGQWVSLDSGPEYKLVGEFSILQVIDRYFDLLKQNKLAVCDVELQDIYGERIVYTFFWAYKISDDFYVILLMKDNKGSFFFVDEHQSIYKIVEPEIYNNMSALFESDMNNNILPKTNLAKNKNNTSVNQGSTTKKTNSENKTVPNNLSKEKPKNSEFDIKDNVLIKYRGKKSNVIVPDGIVEIGDSAFKESMTVGSITLPNSVKIIGEEAFKSCVRLWQINLPEGLTTIKDRAFNYVTTIKSITFPSSLKHIGKEAFSFNGFYEITIPSSIKELKSKTFANALYLKTVIFEGNPILSDDVFQNSDTIKTIRYKVSIEEAFNSIIKGSNVIKLSKSKIKEIYCKDGVLKKKFFGEWDPRYK